MWKCIMCETNNADDSESCFICHTSKDDTKKYYEKLKNLSYLDDYNVKEPEYNHRSSPKPRETPKPVSSPKPAPKSSAPVMPDVYDFSDDDWIDKIGVSEKKKKKIKIGGDCSKGEKIFMIIVTIMTIIMLTLSYMDEKYYLFQISGIAFMMIVPVYLTIKGVTIINTKSILAIFLKFGIWFIICILIIAASRICLSVINLM